MRSKELSDYIQQHQALFWYTPPEKLETITEVENYFSLYFDKYAPEIIE